MDVVELAQKLIRIPSYVDGDVNEALIGEFLHEYLGIHCPWLTLQKQTVDGNRFNIVATDGREPQLLICGHLDTVQPRQGWPFDQFEARIVDGYLYGLGSADMKGDLAAAIKAIETVGRTRGLALLLYIDEEYRFQGMKKFIAEFGNHIKPRFVLSMDGLGMQIVNGCRGCVTQYWKVRGKSGHGAHPASGRNAILGVVDTIRFLEDQFRSHSVKELGLTTVNLALLRGGFDTGQVERGNIVLSQAANNIPDVAEVRVSIRPSTSRFDAQSVIKLVRQRLKALGLSLEDFWTSDYGPWLTPRPKLRFLESILETEGVPVAYRDLSTFGYLDTQMLHELWSCDSVSFGAGENPHAVNERVAITDLITLENVVAQIIRVKLDS